MNTKIGNAIEIVANLLYLIKHEADDSVQVRELAEMAEPSIELLLRSAMNQPETPDKPYRA